MIGQRLGHFEILEKLGEGGMGVVYKARDTHLDRLVAIKILSPDTVADIDHRRRLAREAKTASALNHPGIVTIHDITEHGGIDFIAMEFVPGRTLAELIPRDGLGVKQTLDYGIQIADALAAAHAAGVIHRDLKPGNVIVTEQGRVKVLDFGLAKLVETPAQTRNETPTHSAPLTALGTIVGTAAYMSPEQAEGKTVDARTDIFSFGSLLYEMVSGQRAFQGASPLATLTAILREEPKPIRNVTEAAARELARIITRCLRKDPERRWQSIADVKVALWELKDDPDSGALPASTTGVPRWRRGWIVAAALTLVVAGGAIGAQMWRDRGVGSAPRGVSFNAIPLTTYPGREQQPTFSPDGNSVAFSWSGETEENWDIYVKLIGPGSPQRLTTDAGIDLSPAWSPDGRSIAFGRVRGGSVTVVVVPSRGGPERELASNVRSRSLGVGQMFAWSADSRRLVLAGALSTDAPDMLRTVDVATGETRPLTAPPPTGKRDSLPSVSADGRMLAFVRTSPGQTGELHVLPLSPEFASIGEPQRIAGGSRLYHGVAWSADGQSLIVSSGNTGDVGLWRIPIQHPEQLERLSPSGEESRQPAVAWQQSRLAFTRATWDENIWRLPLSGPGRPAGPPVTLVGSTRSELNAQFSPDAARVVFESLRSGGQELWVADGDGRNALQLTSFNGHRGGTPAWSPDGQSIAYDVRSDEGQSDIFVIPARGGAPVRVTNHRADDLVPSWSRDGQSIYFGSTRTGIYQVWKVSPRGGEPVQVTQHGGTYAKESADGKHIYYAKLGASLPTLWRMPVSGGEEVQIPIDLASYGNFAVVRDGIYFESAPPGTSLGHIPMSTPFTRPQATLDFLSFATGKVTRVMTIDRHAGHGLDVSPDGHTLLFAQMDSFSEDLMLVENFR